MNSENIKQSSLCQRKIDMLNNKIEKFTSLIFAEKENLSLENRLFLSSILVGIFISTIASVMAAIVSIESIPFIVSCVITFLLFIVYYFVRTKRIIEPFIIPILLFSFVGIFIIWIFAGGMHGQNMLPAFVILILALIILPDRKKKYFILLFLILVVIVYLIQYYKPDLIIDYPSEIGRWIDSFGTTIYSAFCLYLIILFFHKHYTMEKQRAEESENKINILLAEKENLLREVHHRVKNNISSIEGLLSLQADDTTNSEVTSALREAISNVQSMRVLYDKLLFSKDYREVSIKDYIESLIDSIAEVIPESGKVTIEKQITDFNLNTNKLVSIGMAVNEILTNAFKYAFKEKDSGHISIIIGKTENNVTLTVRDNGVGLNDGFDLDKSSGFGSMILKMLATSCTIENHNGTISTLEFDI